MASPRGRALSLALLVLVMLIWGSTYVVTKAGLDELPPMMFALLRFSVASACLVPLALLRGGAAALPGPWPWRTLALMGLTGVVLLQVSQMQWLLAAFVGWYAGYFRRRLASQPRRDQGRRAQGRARR